MITFVLAVGSGIPRAPRLRAYRKGFVFDYAQDLEGAFLLARCRTYDVLLVQGRGGLGGELAATLKGRSPHARIVAFHQPSGKWNLGTADSIITDRPEAMLEKLAEILGHHPGEGQKVHRAAM